MAAHRYFLLCIAFLVSTMLTVAPATSQSLTKIEKQAFRSFEKGNYVDARRNFEKLHRSSFNLQSSSLYLARCYLELHHPQQAYNILKKVENPSQEHLYWLITASYSLEKFQEADQLIRDFEDTASYNLSEITTKVELAMDSYVSERGYLVQNFGPEINTEAREYSAIMYNDYNKLLYTSRKESGSNTAYDGLAYETIYSTEIDTTDTWKKAQPLNTGLNQATSHDATVQIFSNGRKMISYRDGLLFVSENKEGIWSNHEELIIHGLQGSDTHCFMTEDEKTLFFASDYRSETGDLDLYVTYKNEAGGWSEPRSLEVLNTKYDEDSPFLAKDGTLYFSSRGHDSMGGYDIFKSSYDSLEKSWKTPENLGFPINTVAEDTYYTTDGKLGYLSSTRKGGYGSLDLYRVFLFNKVKVQGVMYNDQQEPMSNASITVNYDSTTLHSYTDENGRYEMFVPINQKMKIKFVKDSLNQFEGDYIVNIFMKDENSNEFNFYIDYLSTANEDSSVKHINIAVRNDQKENSIIASTSAQEERAWTDSVNHAIMKRRTVERGAPEVTLAILKGENKVDIQSQNLRLRNASVESNNKPAEVADATFKKSTKSDSTGYTVQILAKAKKNDPDQRYFEHIDTKLVIESIRGNDGLERYFIGVFRTQEEASRILSNVRNNGYNDAFVRKLSAYSQF